MNRYRITVLVVCCILIALGGADINSILRNYEPEVVAWDLKSGALEPSKEWLTLNGGVLMLEEAISTSGELEIDALLVPYVRDIDEKKFFVLIETRDPKLVEAFTIYHLALESEPEKAKFLQENLDTFRMQRPVSGMVVQGLIANRNRDTLFEFASETGMDVPEEVVFIHEGNEPPPIYRGLFFLLMAIAGIIKVIVVGRNNKSIGDISA